MQNTHKLQSFNLQILDFWTLQVLRVSEWREFDKDKDRKDQKVLGTSVTVMVAKDDYETNGYEKNSNYGEHFTIKLPDVNVDEIVKKYPKGSAVRPIGVIKANLYSSRNNGFMDSLSMQAKALLSQAEYDAKKAQRH